MKLDIKVQPRYVTELTGNYGAIYCPKCRFFMENMCEFEMKSKTNILSWTRCSNPNCELHNKKFEIPIIELKEIES